MIFAFLQRGFLTTKPFFKSIMPLPPTKLRNRIKLSRQELCGISQAISRDFSPRFIASKTSHDIKTQFSSQELREISRQISREYAPSRDASLPRLVLLAVSPKRLHAYWHITKQRLTQRAPEPAEHPQPLTLRIYTEAKAEAAPNQPETAWFEVPITSEDGHQDIYVPDTAPSSPPLQYRAALGELKSDRIFVPLAYSNSAQAPQATAAAGEPTNAFAAFIISASSTVSSVGPNASGQGKSPPR